jgi:hypothetical protein
VKKDFEANLRLSVSNKGWDFESDVEIQKSFGEKFSNENKSMLKNWIFGTLLINILNPISLFCPQTNLGLMKEDISIVNFDFQEIFNKTNKKSFESIYCQKAI